MDETILRRFFIVVTLVLLLAVSGVIGVLAADWPFYKRLFNLPYGAAELPDSFYQPVVAIEGAPAQFFPEAAPDQRSIGEQTLQDATNWAAANGTLALLVLHRGHVQLERYWQGMSGDTLYSGGAMSRSLLGFAFGFARADGAIRSLDEPLETWLDEWQGESRGKITLRDLLHNLSGLEEMALPPVGESPRAAMLQRVLARVKPLYSKDTRLLLDEDFAHAALAFNLVHEPGTRFAVSDANAQLLGVILERATHTDYERYIDAKLWRPLGAGRAEFYMDRANGMPAVYCCFRATPRDWLRLGTLFLNDGTLGGRRVLPRGWIHELTTTSRVNPLYGMQVWAGKAPAGLRESIPGSHQGVLHGEPYLANEVMWMEGGGRTIWAIPSEELVIVRLGPATRDWDGSFLPNTILRGLLNRKAAP
ncbi:MAG TPA: serine hydrolase [Steroidobacteraceae bacterium]